MKVRTEAKREVIVQEARRLFLEMGYERATMGELSRRIGGSKATLYGYFRSKEELFVAVIEQLAETHLEDAVTELGHLGRDNLATGLTRFAFQLMRLMTEPDALAMQRVVVGESSRTDVGEMFSELGPGRVQTALTAALRAAMDRGDLQPGPADVLAMQFMGLVRAEIDLRSFMRSPAPLAASQLQVMARRAVQMFLGGYAAVGATALPEEQAPGPAAPADGHDPAPKAA
ncbi:TetR/AcrR family transcriptional regulator [Ideonella sp. DXS29W]|uniref:TetR/AcrR family transcriptional regulator n=1 Tax=Ideonella lacteola TaxID=2984193 RepID=A0ABU9BV12_9BURK